MVWFTITLDKKPSPSTNPHWIPTGSPKEARLNRANEAPQLRRRHGPMPSATRNHGPLGPLDPPKLWQFRDFHFTVVPSEEVHVSNQMKHVRKDDETWWNMLREHLPDALDLDEAKNPSVASSSVRATRATWHPWNAQWKSWPIPNDFRSVILRAGSFWMPSYFLAMCYGPLQASKMSREGSLVN